MPEPIEEHAGLTVHYPRFFYVPGILKTMDGAFYDLGLRRWLKAYCGVARPELLDAHFEWPDGVGVSRLAQHVHLPYVITLRGRIYPCLKNRSMIRQFAEALRNAAAVISVSRPMAEIAVELGMARERVHIIPNGVDTERFRPRGRIRARRELGLPADVPLLVCIGHLKRSKGQNDVVQALSHLPPETHLVVVGGAFDAGANEVRALVTQLGFSKRVTFAGRQPHERIPLYLGAADVSILASHNEGCPNVVLESLACGTPVVATRVGAVPDLLTPGRNGATVPVGDPSAIAAAVSDILAKRWSPEQIAGSAIIRSWDAVAREVLRVLEGVLGQKGTGPAHEEKGPCGRRGASAAGADP
jgi:glycosyltransferase involved in cell wall biosynthesis